MPFGVDTKNILHGKKKRGGKRMHILHGERKEREEKLIVELGRITAGQIYRLKRIIITSDLVKIKDVQKWLKSYDKPIPLYIHEYKEVLRLFLLEKKTYRSDNGSFKSK